MIKNPDQEDENLIHFDNATINYKPQMVSDAQSRYNITKSTNTNRGD